jgi:hypothetical protein
VPNHSMSSRICNNSRFRAGIYNKRISNTFMRLQFGFGCDTTACIWIGFLFGLPIQKTLELIRSLTMF